MNYDLIMLIRLEIVVCVVKNDWIFLFAVG